MREAAHDLRDRAAVHTEVVRSLLLAPTVHKDGVQDVASRDVVTGELCGHDVSFTEIGLRDAVRLER